MSEKNHETQQQASAEIRYIVKSSQLPLACPMPGMRLWDAHPRVYLPIEKTGYVVCPYCQAEFVLDDNGNVE